MKNTRHINDYIDNYKIRINNLFKNNCIIFMKTCALISMELYARKMAQI